MAERKGKKLRRISAKSRSYYALQTGRTDDNCAKRMRKHIRSNPDDGQAKIRYEKDMGRADSFGLNSRGRKLAKRHRKNLRQSQIGAGA